MLHQHLKPVNLRPGQRNKRVTEKDEPSGCAVLELHAPRLQPTEDTMQIEKNEVKQVSILLVVAAIVGISTSFLTTFFTTQQNTTTIKEQTGILKEIASLLDVISKDQIEMKSAIAHQSKDISLLRGSAETHRALDGHAPAMMVYKGLQAQIDRIRDRRD